MMRKLVRLLLSCVALAPLGCGQAQGVPTARVHYPFVLTQNEINLARSLAEDDLLVDGVPSGPKTILIKVDLLPDSQAETTQRLVMVHHYRYQTDETIFTMIDLESHQILKREISAHYPMGLAPAEIEEAQRLARNDPRLWPQLEAFATAFDARPIQYSNPSDPLFGHRVVHLLMRRDGNYLTNPRVLVDLSTGVVHLEENQGPTE